MASSGDLVPGDTPGDFVDFQSMGLRLAALEMSSFGPPELRYKVKMTTDPDVSQQRRCACTVLPRFILVKVILSLGSVSSGYTMLMFVNL